MRTFAHVLLMIAFVAAAIWFGKWMLDRLRGDRIVDATPQQIAQARGSQAQAAAQAAMQGAPAAAAALRPRLPMELRLSFEGLWPSLSWVIGLSFGTLVLLAAPDLLWSRWLAWPVAAGMALFGIMEAVALQGQWAERLIVTAEGLEHRLQTGPPKQVAWREVAAIRRIDTMRTYSSGSAKGWSLGSRRVDASKLVFADSGGRTLLEVSLPLAPSDAFDALLAALPALTGTTVVVGQAAP